MKGEVGMHQKNKTKLKHNTVVKFYKSNSVGG